MRELADDYVNGSKAAVRDVFAEIRLKDDENTVYDTDRLMPISVQRGITDGSFGIGFTKSDRISFSAATTEKIPKRTRITLYTAFSKDGTQERLGRFYCENSSRDGNFINVTAFDAMNILRDKPVKFTAVSSKDLAALEFPCMMQDVLDYIVKRWGLTCEFECQPFTVAKKPMKSETEPYNADEILGFIASAHGCNARFNYRGRLEFKSFTAVDTEITASMVIDQTIDDSEPFTVTGVLFTNGDDQIYIDDVSGSEYDEDAVGVIKCENPFATVEIAEYVWSQIGGLSYYAGSLKIRGAGILECGDVVTVRNLKCPDDNTLYPMCITGISYSIGSDGFVETLTSEVNKSGGQSVSSSSSGGSGSGVGIFVNEAKNAERFNHYEDLYANTLAGEFSHAEGYLTAAKGKFAHAEGDVTEAAGEGSHAEGSGAKATGHNAHAEGNNTQATEWAAHAEGDRCKATGRCSHASGDNTIAAGAAQAVFGKYNIEDDTSLFIIGCGTYNARANALWVDKSGNLYVRGSITAGGGTISGGAAYTAGDGIDISEDNVITVKIGEGVEISDDGKITVKKYTAGNGVEIAVDEETGEQIIAVRIGSGLKFSDNGALTVTEYEAGDGLELNENKFSVKIGAGLKIADNGAIETIGGSGGSYSAGDGIEIIADEETGEEKISVKVGEGLEIDGNGAVSSMVNADKAIIIQEADAKYLLHSYTQVDYIKGNKIGYAGPFNQIIVGGYICYAYKGTAPNGVVLNSISTTDPAALPDIPMYTGFAFDEPYLYFSGTRAAYKTFEVKFVSMDTAGITYSDTYLLENGTVFTGTPYKTYAGYDMGCAFLWQSIIKPGDSANGKVYPYGGVQAVRAKRYKSNATTYVFALDSTWTLPFASEAEYNAAVGLTYEPVTLTEVQETVTEV